VSRILAVDWGTQNIGLAICSKELLSPSPLKNIKNNKNSISELVNLIDVYNVDTVVFGLPVYPVSGNPNELFPLIKNFASLLYEEVKKKLNRDIKVEFVEEEYTTEIAKLKYSQFEEFKNLKINEKGSKFKRKKKNRVELDKYSAVLILESYINQKKAI